MSPYGVSETIENGKVVETRAYAAQRKYYEKNKAKVLAAHREYYENNKAKVSAAQRKYYENNKAKVFAAKRERRKSCTKYHGGK